MIGIALVAWGAFADTKYGWWRVGETLVYMEWGLAPDFEHQVVANGQR